MLLPVKNLLFKTFFYFFQDVPMVDEVIAWTEDIIENLIDFFLPIQTQKYMNQLHNRDLLYIFFPRTTDAQGSIFSLKFRTFGLGQTNWADTFWGIWSIFGQTISTHFGTVSPLSMFSIIQPLFQQKTKPLYPNPNYFFGIEIWIWIWAAKN